jgi:hypothetical protein
MFLIINRRNDTFNIDHIDINYNNTNRRGYFSPFEDQQNPDFYYHFKPIESKDYGIMTIGFFSDRATNLRRITVTDFSGRKWKINKKDINLIKQRAREILQGEKNGNSAK